MGILEGVLKRLKKSKSKDVPRESGVYQIRCVATGKIYVGSAVDFRARWNHHCDRLKHGKHRNKYLQAAWNKYGEVGFEFSILEFCSKQDLLVREQEWIDQTNCASREVGFNLYDKAGSPGDALAQIWDGFIDPDGNEVVITNLEEFCRQNNLNAQVMRQIARGNTKHKGHKGWSHKNSIRQRDYVKTYDGFIDPNGNRVGPITNLAAFCRERGLDNTHMVAVVNGRLYNHHGYTYDNGRKSGRYKTYRGFINPHGQHVVIENLSEFCRKNNLTVVHMHKLISGERKSHKGWTWRSENE